MSAAYFTLVNPDTDGAFYVSDDNSVPTAFATEDEAIVAAKEYCGTSFVLKVVAKVTEVTKYKIDRFK